MLSVMHNITKHNRMCCYFFPCWIKHPLFWAQVETLTSIGNNVEVESDNLFIC